MLMTLVAGFGKTLEIFEELMDFRKVVDSKTNSSITTPSEKVRVAVALE